MIGGGGGMLTRLPPWDLTLTVRRSDLTPGRWGELKHSSIEMVLMMMVDAKCYGRGYKVRKDVRYG